MVVRQSIYSLDKQFLLSIKNLNPDWSLYDFERFPAVQWKIRNLEKLKMQNPKKYQKQQDLLKEYLENSKILIPTLPV